MNAPLLSVVVPVFDEESVLPTLARTVKEAAGTCGPFEVIFVNDGSRDGSGRVLDELARVDPRVRVVHLSRNFGQQAALQAGIVHASGEAIVVMDADMQDDPRAIPALLAKWREGYHVVYGRRVRRKENAVKRGLFSAFYVLLNRVSHVPMPLDAGNFGLVDARVAGEILRLSDRDRYYPGLRSWVGFRQVGIDVERGARYDEDPRVSLYGLWRLAKSAIFSFSSFPLSTFYGIATVSLLTFAALGSFTLYHKLVTGLAIPGWTSNIMTACFFGALNSLGIAILGEYVRRIYDQVRMRPIYLVERTVNFPAGSPGARDEK